MNRRFCREVLDCASALALFDGQSASEGGRGLPQSKTLARERNLQQKSLSSGRAASTF